uniref:G protein-coupled receptor 156 n=1 Tax=Salarias fasciatus TaxID=181472 RepID=A0A672GTR8_SALFA
MAVELPRRSLSPVLTAVVWTLLSCGILLAFCFLLFTLRFKNNRIVKMSSPNLNVLTLCGSVLTYGSGFLFFAEVLFSSLQAQMWMLCVGSTLVFGPILGKTWRLYRVFTQRVPDKRVIIRDIQLMGMVALLILVDLLILTAWNVADPVRCSRSVNALVKVDITISRDISYSLSQMDSCSSLYSNLWVILITFQKGGLLLYGVYLAGLTSNVSHPPVNQSPTIITAVALVTLSSAVAIPVSVFLQAWPNLVYSTVAGAIFICTLATNCMLFVPQLTQWRQFEDDQNNPSQMAKYFSSPSKSQPSVYSQDEICYLLGENSSMKKLLNEKNAVIDSLQEQVNNAKDKLLRLMSASQPAEGQDADSSTTNFNSSSTQTTELQCEGPSSSSSVSQRDPVSKPPSAQLAPHLPAAPASVSAVAPPSEPTPDPSASVSSQLLGDTQTNEPQRDASAAGSPEPALPPFSGSMRTAEETVEFVTSLQSRREAGAFGGLAFQLEPAAAPPCGFISSEQLQEILQELSVDAVTETALRSPGQASGASSQLRPSATLSPLSPRTPRSPPPPVLFRYPSISPYAMRKRRPPFHSPRSGLAPPCFYAGSEISSCGQKRHDCDRQNAGKHPEGPASVDPLLSGDSQVATEEENSQNTLERRGRCQGCISRSHRCSVLQCGDQSLVSPPDVDLSGASGRPQRKHMRDSCGFWDSDSSSSTDYCYYHRPYCDSCRQRGSLLCSDSSSDSSDSEYDDYAGLYRSSRPVVFKEDLKPTFV